jgi:hypothetical protein
VTDDLDDQFLKGSCSEIWTKCSHVSGTVHGKALEDDEQEKLELSSKAD